MLRITSSGGTINTRLKIKELNTATMLQPMGEDAGIDTEYGEDENYPDIPASKHFTIEDTENPNRFSFLATAMIDTARFAYVHLDTLRDELLLVPDLSFASMELRNPDITVEALSLCKIKDYDLPSDNVASRTFTIKDERVAKQFKTYFAIGSSTDLFGENAKIETTPYINNTCYGLNPLQSGKRFIKMPNMIFNIDL